MVDAPGKTKIKIVDISVILKDTINLKIVFYRFFQHKTNPENRKFLSQN
jgi:hypothetical protein